MKRTQLHIAEDQLSRLRDHAKDKRATVADLVRRAIERYLEAEDERVRRSEKAQRL